MSTLWLLRHAKAVAGSAKLDDRERPLEERGREAAARVGRHLCARGVRPDLVLCSPSVRTLETLGGVARELGGELDVRVESELYLASAADLLHRLERLPDSARSVLIVAHNPGIGELAARLAVRGDASGREELRRKFPTGALAELRIPSQHWRDLARGCELVAFVVPGRAPR